MVNPNTQKPVTVAKKSTISCNIALKKHFPMIRDRLEILEEIQSKPNLQKVFNDWDKEYQEDFLDMCTGVKGIKLLYDSYFKEIMNPDTVPERLEDLLSHILGKNVTILKVLPNDSARIAAENSLLVLDIVVELEDGSLANVEVQKIGYAFPGERTSCYSADLLLRQYKRIRGQKGKKFQYKDIKKVYTIVFLEKSTSEFHQLPNSYIHYGTTSFDTGLKLNLLQEYIFIALDILKEKQQNENVIANNRLEAWLTFFHTDEPEKILQLLEQYPEFKPLYEEVYEMCQNMEQMMGWFTKELIELDKNTVQYMIDEMQDTIDTQKEQLETKNKQLETKELQLQEERNINIQNQKLMNEMRKEIQALKANQK